METPASAPASRLCTNSTTSSETSDGYKRWVQPSLCKRQQTSRAAYASYDRRQHVPNRS